MNVTGHQIRAARALLGWSTADLVEKIGLTRETINHIENGHTNPREGTMADIVRAFDEQGVEFTDNSGVRLKPQGIELLIGPEGLCRFFDGVYEYSRLQGGTIRQLGIDEDLFWVMGDYSAFHRERMTKLVHERKDLKVLAIVCEGDRNFVAADYNQYRWISKEIFAPVPFYIYGDRLAIMNFQTTPAPTIILHKFPAVTEAYRKQFDAMWKLSTDPDAPKAAKPPAKGRGRK
jgi:DNA-binding XRE family transcriptional regulator